MSTTKNHNSDFPEVVQRLMELSGKSRELDIAELLGMKKAAFATRKLRDRLPIKEIKITCANHGWSYDWVVTGKGRKLLYPVVTSDQQVEYNVDPMRSITKPVYPELSGQVEKYLALDDLARHMLDKVLDGMTGKSPEEQRDYFYNLLKNKKEGE